MSEYSRYGEALYEDALEAWPWVRGLPWVEADAMLGGDLDANLAMLLDPLAGPEDQADAAAGIVEAYDEMSEVDRAAAQQLVSLVRREQARDLRSGRQAYLDNLP